jgi:hypothetical protein
MASIEHIGASTTISSEAVRMCFQTRISPLLPIIGNHCVWCVSSSGTSVLTLVKTHITNNYVGTTLTSSIWSAKSSIDVAFKNYLVDTWIANLSTTVSWWNVNQYNSFMSSAVSNMGTVGTLLDSALADARDALAMIDDLSDLIWTQKVSISTADSSRVRRAEFSEAVSESIGRTYRFLTQISRRVQSAAYLPLAPRMWYIDVKNKI